MGKIIQKVKVRLETVPNNLEDLVEEVGYRILAYCNRDDIPIPLELVWIRMVVDFAESTGKQYLGKQIVSSMSEGDTSINFESERAAVGVNASLLDTVVLNYGVDLNRYRKLRAVR